MHSERIAIHTVGFARAARRLARTGAWIPLTVLIVLSSCIVPPPADHGPDVAAIITVVEAVYGQQEPGRTIFLGTDGAERTLATEARPLLETSLNTKVLTLTERKFDGSLPPFTPVDPETGEAGVMIALGRFSVDEQGQLHVSASFVKQSGSERGCIEFLLVREGEGWSIIDARDARPNCVLSEEVLESYDAVLERVRGGDCVGLGAAIGTCGSWLAIREHTIDTYRTSYFDPETRLMVARDWFDIGEEGWEFGQVDCDEGEFVRTEYVLCGRRAEP